MSSSEEVFLGSIGLENEIAEEWKVQPRDVSRWCKVIVSAKSLQDLRQEWLDNENGQPLIRKYIVTPAHYKKVREVDEEAFASIWKKVEDFPRPFQVTDETINWMVSIYNLMIFRATGERKDWNSLDRETQDRVLDFFRNSGGIMFFKHIMALAKHHCGTKSSLEPNAFYDLLQLILLKDPNSLFVTNDGAFWNYFGGLDEHRVLTWNQLKGSI